MRLVLVLKALEMDEDQDVTGDRAVTEDQVVGTASDKRHSDIMDS